MKLPQGGNAPVPASEMSVVVQWSSNHGVDPQALLLADDGRIRTNDDFVFYNAPRHPSGAVTVTDTVGHRAVLRVGLARVEPGIDRIVLAASVDSGTFREVRGLQVAVHDSARELAVFEFSPSEPVTAIVLGEFYRRNGGWKVRCVGQGWDSGLRGLAEEYGVEIDDPAEPGDIAPAGPPVPPPLPRTDNPAPLREPGWYPESGASGTIRWWNGTAWTDDRRQVFPADPAICERCGRPKRVPRFGAPPPCRWCESEVNAFLEVWRTQAWHALTTTGPRGEGWHSLWTALRFHRIHEATGREALRPLAIAYLERLVAFAFADGEIEQHELDHFEGVVRALLAAADLGPARQRVDELRARMLRGRALTQVRAGDLPRIQRPNLHLEADEIAYIDVDAAQVKYLASGPRHNHGRLIGSSKKVRFVGVGAGGELPWSKIVSVTSEYGNVVIAATTARGGGTYQVRDPEYVAAVLEGALRVAKRLVLAPGRRDSRSIPPAVKSEVWQRDGGRCCQCGSEHYLEFDHVIPLSRGGATSVNNLQILCRRCNLEKGVRL
ncbi:TerD family protein [Nocardia farcinica]|uniref:TerD family protein n=1 Tax=Nocardia farcinica TaxID=37329 RepID=UPI000E1C3E20|nr:TerD family protein [Nocardia farcinica]MBF6522604.1 TerD family protein [Nocardia farcinica]